MTTMKKLVAVVVFGALGLAFAASSKAAGGTGGTSPAPSVVSTGTISPNVCPQGWQVVKDTRSGDAYTCQPTKMQQMVQCPAHLVYFDNGCSIGCVVPAS